MALELERHDGTTFIDCTKTIAEYVDQEDWRVRANSNVSYSAGALVNNTAGKAIANYWLDAVYSPEEGAAHREGKYHIHDLDSLTGYCAGWNLRKLLDEGFNGIRGRVNSKAPKHLSSALGQMANFMGILQTEWAGAQAFSSFDTFLAPYVFIDKLSYKQVRDAIESFVFNLNVPSRWSQSPFTNITIDWTVPNDLKDQMPTRNGDHMFEGIDDPELIIKAKERGCETLTDLCYKHFLPEMRMLQKAYFEVMTEGDITGQPFTFPIPTVNITEDFDWDSENIETLFENTAKRGSSYFQNFVGSQYKKDENGNLVPDEEAYKPDAVRSMCPLTLDTEVVTRTGEEIGYKTVKDLDPETDEVYGLGGNWYKFEKTEVFTGKKVIQFKVYSLWHKEECIVKMSEDHLQPVTKWQDGGLSYENKPAKDIKEGDSLPGVMQTPVGTGIAEYKVLEKKYLDGTEPVQCISVKDSPDNLFILNCGLITHNCRLQLDLRELQRRGNGLFGSAESTGSIGVCTINMARLGYLHKGDKRGLYKELDQLMDMAKSTLEKKRVKITELFERGLYPYTKRYLPVGFKNHFSTIGVNGINEMIRNYTSDKHSIADEKGKAMALEVINHMREKMRKYQEETGHLYNLEASPSEGACYRFAREDLKRYPDIIQAGYEGHHYYTNSSQLPSSYSDDMFEVLEHQNDLQPLYTGGSVLHMYMGEEVSSPGACKELVKRIVTNYRIPYITITPTFSVCEKHGYITGKHEYCPYCDAELISNYRKEQVENSKNDISQ